MTALHPLINHEPHRLSLAAEDGTVTLPINLSIADAARSALAGFGGMRVIVAIRNANGSDTASDADGEVQIETTTEVPGAITNYSAPAGLLLEFASIDDGDVVSYEISGPPGQLWRVLNSAGVAINVEYYYVPSRN